MKKKKKFTFTFTDILSGHVSITTVLKYIENKVVLLDAHRHNFQCIGGGGGSICTLKKQHVSQEPKLRW